MAIGGGALFTWMALVESPSFVGRPEVSAGISYRLFYFHVPAALVSFAAFAVAFYHSLYYLLRPDVRRDQSAQSAIEVGTLFAGVALATGMVWGKAEWGTPFDWEEEKLVLTLFMFLVYTAYLLLRSELDDPDKRSRVAAVYAVAAFATVPLVWFAQKLWDRIHHPEVFGAEAADEGIVTPGIMPVFLLGLVVFLAVFTYFYRWRRHLLHLSAGIRDLETAQEVPP